MDEYYDEQDFRIFKSELEAAISKLHKSSERIIVIDQDPSNNMLTIEYTKN